jgi:hypothetical protein
LTYWVSWLDRAACEVDDFLFFDGQLDQALALLGHFGSGARWEEVHVAEGVTLRFVQEWLEQAEAATS